MKTDIKIRFSKDSFFSRMFAKVFGDDQKNVVSFAVGLAIPGLILAFAGLYITGWGDPFLMTFDIALTAFIVWAIVSAAKMWNQFVDINDKWNKHSKEY